MKHRRDVGPMGHGAPIDNGETPEEMRRRARDLREAGLDAAASTLKRQAEHISAQIPPKI